MWLESRMIDGSDPHSAEVVQENEEEMGFLQLDYQFKT